MVIGHKEYSKNLFPDSFCCKETGTRHRKKQRVSVPAVFFFDSFDQGDHSFIFDPVKYIHAVFF